MRRRVATAVACLVAGLVSISGCAGAPAPAATVPMDAKAALDAAIARFGDQPVKFMTKKPDASVVFGEMDPKTDTASITVYANDDDDPTPMEITLVGHGDDVFLKADKAGAEEWMHTSRSRLKDTVLHLTDPGDPAGLARLAQSVENLEYDGPNVLKGTIDLRQWPVFRARSAATNALIEAVPLKLNLDSAGRLSFFMARLDQGAIIMSGNFEYGVTVEAKLPDPGTFAEAPDSVLALLMG